MNKLKIALAQIKTDRNYKINLEKIIDFMQKAKSFGAELVVFPETSQAFVPSNEGINFNTIAQNIDEEFVTSIINKSKELNIAVVFGFYEKDNEKTKNSVIFADCGKIIHKYSKTHLYDAFSYDESKDINASNEKIKAFDTKWGKMGMMVCYELRFPEIARTLALDGARLVLVPTAWVDGKYKDEHFMLLTKTRALENTIYLCASNQTGNIYTGRSALINPLGLEEIKLGVDEGIQIFEIDFNKIDEVRKTLPCISQRKPNLYSL